MLTKLLARFLRPLKNRKGFTFIEAIAVVAIMGILSVTVGSLVTSGVRAYMRQSDRAAMTEISSIIENEIARYITAKGVDHVYLQNGRMAPGRVDEETEDTDSEGNLTGMTVLHSFNFRNAPIGEYASFFSSNYTYTTTQVTEENEIKNSLVGHYFGEPIINETGRVFISDATGYAVVANEDGTRDYSDDYFVSNEAEERAFYGSNKVKLSFSAIATNGRFYSVEIFADIIDADGNVVYKSPGTIATFLDRVTATSNMVSSFYNENVFFSKILIPGTGDGENKVFGGFVSGNDGVKIVSTGSGLSGLNYIADYVNKIEENVRYTHLYVSFK